MKRIKRSLRFSWYLQCVVSFQVKQQMFISRACQVLRIVRVFLKRNKFASSFHYLEKKTIRKHVMFMYAQFTYIQNINEVY